MRAALPFVLLLACRAPASPPAAAPDAGAAAPVIQLADQLAKEAKTRPTGTPTADQVYAALVQRGIPVERRRQVVALTLKASYCEGAFAGGFGIAVCEYPDEAAAAAGREHALTAFKARGVREIFVNKKTTVTVTVRSDAGGEDALMQKVRETVEQL